LRRVASINVRESAASARNTAHLSSLMRTYPHRGARLVIPAPAVARAQRAVLKPSVRHDIAEWN
jgi:hypothetical protein